MKLLKPLILLVALLAFAPAVRSQDNDKILNRPYADMKRLHYGFSVGFYNQSLGFSRNGYVTESGESWYPEIAELAPGFCVNILGDLRLAEHFNLRLTPGLYFGSKTVTFREATTGELEKQSIKNSSVVIPLDVKMSATRYHNLRPYVTAGAMAAFDVSKRKDGELLQLNNTNLYLTLGFGLDIYVPFFKFVPEVKFCFGLGNLLKKDRPDLVDDVEKQKFTQSIDRATSNMVVFTFYFE